MLRLLIQQFEDKFWLDQASLPLDQILQYFILPCDPQHWDIEGFSTS